MSHESCLQQVPDIRVIFRILTSLPRQHFSELLGIKFAFVLTAVPWKSQTLTKEEAQAAGIGAEAAPSAKSAPAACIEQPVESSSWPAIEGKGDATLLMRPGSSGSGESYCKAAHLMTTV